MKHLTTYKIFESSGDWVTSVDEVKEHFYDLEDLSNTRIDKLWLSKDLKEFARSEKPGYYPGFIVSVRPTFSTLDFDKFIEYLSGISACNKRLPEYFNMCGVETTSQSQYDISEGLY